MSGEDNRAVMPGDKNWRGSRGRKSARAARDPKILQEYLGLNESQTRVPAVVLAKRFNLTRQRIYTIIAEQQRIRAKRNARMEHPSKDTEAAAVLVAEMLSDLLGAG